MKQVGNTILAKGGNHILAKRDNSAWPKGSKLSGFSNYRLLAYRLDAEYGRGSFSLYRIDGDGCHIRIGTKECRFMSEGCPHTFHVMGWGRYMRN